MPPADRSERGLTSNGAVLFLLLCTVVLFLPTRFVLPIFASGPIFALAIFLRPIELYRAVRQAVLITAPLFLFLVLVWVVVVEVAPRDVLFVYGRVPLSPIEYVCGVASRLLLFTLTIAALIQRFTSGGAVAFVQGLWCAQSLKALVLTTLSLKNTIAQAAGRAHTALVAARVLTMRASWLNVKQGWRLIQGVWMATLSMALERLDTKWQLEGLPEGFALSREGQAMWSRQDVIWCALPTLAGALAVFRG